MAEPRGPLMSPGFWLHHAALAWRQAMEHRLRPLGLTPTQFNLLASTGWLARTGEPPTQQQVADNAGADRMMASKVLRGLQDRGLLARSADPHDSRTLRLRLTDEGRALASQAIRLAVDLDEELFGDDSDRLREELRNIAMSARPLNIP
jgi:DNA-binding MarR family transcriptional regulator